MPIEWFCCMIYSICNTFYSDSTARPETIISASIHYHRKWNRHWLLTDVPRKILIQYQFDLVMIIYWATVNIPTPNQYGDYYEFGIQFQLARNELYIPTTQFGIRTSCLFNTSAHLKHLQQIKTPQSYELDTAEQSMADTMFISPQYRFNLPLLDYEKHNFVYIDASINTLIIDVNNVVEKFIKFATGLILQ